MGTQIIDIEYGDDCLHCWPSGETPKFIYIMFDGVKKSNIPGGIQVPNGHLFKCEQDPLTPCRYLYGAGGPTWTLDFWRSVLTGDWHISFSYWLIGSHFSGSIDECPSEHAIFHNLLDDPNLFLAYDGVATIIWMGEANKLLDDINIPNDGTLMEFFLIDELEPVYKFCNLKYSINQCIHIE